jgi:putative hydrolase of the HAD superfamily
MYKNIIFDMGNVLIDFSPMQYVGKLNLSDRAEEEKIFKAAYLNFKSIYMDYGRMTEDEFVDYVVNGIGEKYRDKVRELIVNWHQYLTPIKGMEELIKELKDKGYKIYLLSNAGFNQHDYWEKIPASKYFDGKVVSCDVGEVKPFKEIYEALYKKFNIKPEESFFIDDLIINIFGANRTGMDGYVFTGDVNDLRAELRSRSIL